VTQQAPAVGFDNATRSKFIEVPTMTRPTGGGVTTVQIPRTGLLGRMYLIIRGSVAGTLTSPNALGMAAIIKRVRLFANSGIDIFNCSGAAYHYLLRNRLNLGNDIGATANNARSAVTATTFVLDMVIPVAMNNRDPLGLIMLQSEQTVLTLSIEWEADATVATGATVTGTVDTVMEVYTVPQDRRNWPRLDVVHQILEDQTPVSGAGSVVYNWPRGNRYLQVLHGLGIGASGADGFSATQLRVNQSDYIFSFTAANRHDVLAGLRDITTTRVAGSIPIDFLGSAGLGVYDKFRDTLDSGRVTDLATVITATGAGTLYTVRRQLVQLAAPGPAGN
jgi:hypothetical protein